MKTKLTKKEAERKIDEFFSMDNFSAEEVRKIKRLSMKFNIRLGEYKKKFCRKCLEKLRGKNRINKNYKSVKCGNCNHLNRFKIR